MVQFSLSYDDIGRNIEDVKDNIRYPTIVKNIQEVISTHQVFEKEIQTTDGNWFQMNIVPYVNHEDDSINGVIMTFVDITKRLNVIKELEKINAQHQVLMYALSHDVKQPISTLKLLSTGLRETYKRQDQKGFNLMLERLEATSNGIDSLLDEFTFSGEANQKNENTVDIRTICQDVLDALREEIQHNRISITRDFEATTILFPKNNLRSIIYNLLHNSIKYRDHERATQIHISTFKINDFVVFKVEDNGIGVAEEHLETIFQKSSRINEEIEGTGMGLYIIKKMLESNHGRIEVESNFGKGSRFEVFFRDDHKNGTSLPLHSSPAHQNL
ncbi:ATP-binding protein [Antarcticibacterium sp. 1MA-6-2]|uniref:ATP-binding protein n=1 Tax=Antarcticibacterium sp. 1MA-6-2 TaxID=2908210 RepID=UPI001F203A31|nr:ATP-binding protein [Antarcticibacterium sp. 1MA-6-2]UJH90959.1 ATP-binding protein [Antarcticibacterium sp. 1MA-6-2]